MDTNKNFITTIVTIVQLLIWTIIIFYGFVGLWLLIKGNPPEDSSQHEKAYGNAAQTFFLTIIVIPIIFIIGFAFIDNESINVEACADGILIYMIVLVLVWLVGIVNYLISE